MEKKRIVYFIPEFPRISETFIEREVSKLIELDNLDITILSLTKASGSTSDAVLSRTVYKRLGLMDFILGLTYLIAKFPVTLNLFQSLSKDPDIRRGDGREGKTPNNLKFIYFFLKSLGYTRIISKFRPNHIHVHFLSWPSTTVMIASQLLGIPFSISAHAKDVFVEGEFIDQKIDLAKFISICNSNAYKKILEFAPEQANKEKVKLIYHGVDPKIFDQPSPQSCHPEQREGSIPSIFLGGTRLVEKKGLRYMIEASKLLKDEKFTHRVDLVGPGNLYQNLSKLILDLDLSDTVFIHGEGKGTPFREVLEYYKKATIFVLPSIETGEGDVDGVPNVVIEAAMAKLPIITTNAGGITDLVEDGVTGLIVPQKDPQAIAKAIKKLVADTDLSNKLVKNAYIKATEMFDINKNIEALERELLN